MSRVHIALLAALLLALVGMLGVIARTSRTTAPPAAAPPAATATDTVPESPQTTAEPAADGRLALPRPLPRRTLRIPILMYHRVAPARLDASPYERDLTVAPRAFARQMAWLDAQGYASITQRELFDALMSGAPLPRRPVLITFDDGYREIAETAAPIMAEHGFAGTAYVITDRIAADPAAAPQWLDEEQLRDLQAAGWDIGSHTVSHLELPSLADAEALRQLRASRYRLERILGRPVQWFCYPVGRFDDRTVALVRRAGYVLAVTTRPGVTQRASDPLRLERVRISDDTDVRDLARALAA